MKIEYQRLLDFKDVLIKPKRSTISSRKDVDINRSFNFINGNRSWYGFPIIAANMETTGSLKMASSLGKEQCLTALHKFHPNEDLKRFCLREASLSFYTLGMRKEDVDKFNEYLKQNEHPKFICLDVPNGYLQKFVEFCAEIRQKCPLSIIMAGNVVTGEMTQELIINGKVDIVKVGIGSGANCSTRKVAGVGIPQLSAIIDCADVAHGLGAHICSDGGCREPGDVVKAFVAGADFVMLGNGMLGGTDECDGEWYTRYNSYTIQDEKFFLVTHGMSSQKMMEKFYGKFDDYKAEEGFEVRYPYKGPVSKVIQQIKGGVRSACTYVGAARLKDLPKCGSFVCINDS